MLRSLYSIITARDMATALQWLDDLQLPQPALRKDAYVKFTNASGEEMARLDHDALTAERHRRDLFPAKQERQAA